MTTSARDMLHDTEPTKTPTNPKMAGVFDRLVDSNLELTASVRELVDEVRQLVQAMKEGHSK